MSPRVLAPFQKAGVAALAASYRHLLADEPGLGKTAQAIVAAGETGARSVLTLCPASVRSHWADEIRRWSRAAAGIAWDVFSYNSIIVPTAMPMLQPKYDVLILDEAHFLKTPDSQRTIAVLGKGGLAYRAERVWALSGTPVVNRPREFWPLLKALHPGFAGMSWNAFAQQYCGAYFDGRGINTKGASRLDELAERLKGFMTRRTQAEVFPDRVAPVVNVMPLTVADYELAAVRSEEETILNREAYLSPAHEDFAQLGDLSRLLRLTGEAKVPAVAEYVEELLQVVDKVVVFFHHSAVGRRLMDRFTKRGFHPEIYQGGMSDRQKDGAKVRFIESTSCRVFLGQTQAAGTGIDGLQKACSRVVFAEQEWVPGVMGQAIGRLDRMGQNAGFVIADVLHVPGTLEGALLGSRGTKEKVIERLMGDSSAALKGLW